MVILRGMEVKKAANKKSLKRDGELIEESRLARKNAKKKEEEARIATKDLQNGLERDQRLAKRGHDNTEGLEYEIKTTESDVVKAEERVSKSKK